MKNSNEKLTCLQLLRASKYEQASMKKLGMKWYKFNIYFRMILSILVILRAVSDVLVKDVDTLWIVLVYYISLGIWVLFIRHWLVYFKYKGIVNYFVMQYGSPVLGLLVSIIARGSYDMTIVGQTLAMMVMNMFIFIPELIYWKKRKPLFDNRIKRKITRESNLYERMNDENDDGAAFFKIVTEKGYSDYIKDDIDSFSLQKQPRRLRKIFLMIVLFVLGFLAICYLYASYLEGPLMYNLAKKEFEQANYADAYNYYKKVPYKYADTETECQDCLKRISKQIYNRYGLTNDGRVFFYEFDKLSFLDGWDNVSTISVYDTGDKDTLIGLKCDNTVLVKLNGKQKRINWETITDIAAGDGYVIGLRSDGKLEAVGTNHYGQCNVWEMNNVKDICSGKEHTVILNQDGTVVALGNNESNYGEVFSWDKGTYIDTEQKGGRCDVMDWRDITSISAGEYHTVGLKSNGEVVATGSNRIGQCDVDDWTEIEKIYAMEYTTIAQKKDGRFLYMGDSENVDFATINMCK